MANRHGRSRRQLSIDVSMAGSSTGLADAARLGRTVRALRSHPMCALEKATPNSQKSKLVPWPAPHSASKIMIRQQNLKGPDQGMPTVIPTMAARMRRRRSNAKVEPLASAMHVRSGRSSARFSIFRGRVGEMSRIFSRRRADLRALPSVYCARPDSATDQGHAEIIRLRSSRQAAPVPARRASKSTRLGRRPEPRAPTCRVDLPCGRILRRVRCPIRAPASSCRIDLPCGRISRSK
jgi:hypothetical protein